MATALLAHVTAQLVPARDSSGWSLWAASLGLRLRKTLLAYRDCARMVSGTRLTNTEYMKTAELLQVAVPLSTVYSYTLSFVIEEQAVYPRPGERSPDDDIPKRTAKLDPNEFPLLCRSGAILLDNFDRRYKEGLRLIVHGMRHRHASRHA